MSEECPLHVRNPHWSVRSAGNARKRRRRRAQRARSGVVTLVAGVDSSTQSCKVVIRDADTGALVRTGSAPHPDGTEVHPDRWWEALSTAVTQAGGLDDVAAVAVAAQQHGMGWLGGHGAGGRA